MLLNFLAAEQPIAKSYTLDTNGKIQKKSYPFVYEVTSSEIEVLSLQAALPEITKHAALGNCLLKGALARPLVKESRAGSSNRELKTKWICLDLDGVENYQSVDHFLTNIGCGDVSYILQWSSSMGIENNAGFRCHILMELAKEEHPELLKHWLIGLNLNTPTLSSQLQLTKTNNALRWVLDTTTCQNDKLIYIAPPLLGAGIADPYPNNQRITFVQKPKSLLDLPQPIPGKTILRGKTDARIGELRTLAGLSKKKTTKYAFAGATEYLANPDIATITDSKTERGFTYLNLNGGDSWAYYHPEDNPAFVHNFKGEPAYRTQDLLPDYWAQIVTSRSSYQPNAQGLVYLAFRDFTSGNYYNGTYDQGTDQLKLSQAKSETQLRHFMKQHGQFMGDYVPDWDLIFDPHSTIVIDHVAKTINTYQPSRYFLNPGPKQSGLSCPPTIGRIISHVLGGDAAATNHFTNWLGCVVRSRSNVGTAWILQGTQGTGKGILFHQILSPIFGTSNTTAKRMGELEEQFTGYMENKFVVFIDEMETGRSLYHTKIEAKLKNLIVEPMISIRNMYRGAYMAKNYTNLIFASNKAAIEVHPDDRRFNVGGYQDKRLQITSPEVEVLIPQELDAFFAYLWNYPCDPTRARVPLISAARTQLMDISRTAVDTVSDAILNGNLEFFWDQLPSEKSAASTGETSLLTHAYREIVLRMVDNPVPELTRDEVRTLMEWCVGNMPVSPNKFSALMKHHRIHFVPVWKNGRSVRGIKTTWTIEPTWHSRAKNEIITGAV